MRLFEPWYRELGVDKPEMPAHYHAGFATQIEALLEARPPVFSFVFGIPDRRILDECRRLGIVTVGAATSIAEAEALDAARVDLIVATGAEAGGHRPSFLQRAEDSLFGTFVLVQLVADRVGVPVIAAGGIADARGVRAALALGADAAQIGTAFLACEESGTHEAHRQPAVRARRATDDADPQLHRAPGARPAQPLDRADGPAARDPATVSRARLVRLEACERRRLPPGARISISLWSGQIAPNLRHHHAADLMQALIAD